MKSAGTRTRDRAMTLGFVALSFALAFWQRPGWAATDTKIDLHVDPVRFLSQVASVWTPTTDLGNVHSSQYSGYLWPMGPFYALLHSIGVSPWVVQRLWLGLMFALAAWGMLRLLDVLVGRRRGIVHLVAGGFYLANPFVVVFVTRTSLALLGYAALPWLLLITFHGIRTASGWRDWRGWWWAAAFALTLTSTGGGVNAALVGWMLVGPLVLLIYEPTVGAVRWRDSAAFVGRVGVLGVLASLWWIVPVLAHVRYGIDFLKYTEQPSTIWATNSATESLRLMGFWNSYGGVGFGVIRPLFSDAGTLLFNPLVVGASLLLPALAVAGFIRPKRPSYAPLFLALVVIGAVIMVAGFPDGTPLRQAMTWIYHHVFVLRFMRTTYKAAPLVAVGMAGLLGLAAQQLAFRARTLRAPRQLRAAPALAAVPILALIVLAALPMFQGKAIDKQFEWKRIPAAWTGAGHALDRTLPRNTRALVLPGQIFAFYDWGGTGDAILPRLTDRPVAVRYETPYSDLHAAELLNTVDDLVQQRRVVPGQLPQLLGLMGVGAVLTGSDDDISRSGAIDPAAAAGVLRSALPEPPASRYGPVRTLPAAAGDIGPAVRLPQVRRYDTAAPRGLVHVDSPSTPTIVDGSAQGLAGLAAFGGIPASSSLFYAGDLSSTALRQHAARGANVVITDSNRRSVYVPEFAQQNQGPVLSAGEPLPKEAALIDPFSTAGSDTQTVSTLQGAAALFAPGLAGEQQFPEHAPIAAFDGSPATSWVADRFLPLSDAAVSLAFSRPRDVPYVDVLPLSDPHGIVTEVDVNGVKRHVGTGWTRFSVGLHQVASVRVGIDHVTKRGAALGSHGGFREIRIPGVHVSLPLRAPIVAGRALAGVDLRRSALSFQFERQTGDDPFRRNLDVATSVLNNPRERGDPERLLDRIVFAPATRSYTAEAWVYPATDAPDPALDRLVGSSGPATFESSSRFQNQIVYRASRAFTGGAGPGWVGAWAPDEGAPPWISWRLRHPLRVSSLTLAPSRLPVRRPELVRVSWPGGSTPPLAVGSGGAVRLPRPVSASAFRITILRAQFPASASARQREAPAVGIGSVLVPGLPRAPATAGVAVRAPCGSVAVELASRRMPLQPTGTIAALQAGQPLRAHACGGPVSMAAGIRRITALAGTLSVDMLRLESPAPAGTAVASRGGGRILDPGHIGTSSLSGVRVSLPRPAWLVLGESFDKGWSATCDGRSLGAPQVIDGYANGWLAPAGCARVSFSFAPQSSAKLSYMISAICCGALALFLFVGFLLVRSRRGRPLIAPVAPRPASDWPAPPSLPLPLIRAAAIAAVLSLVLGAIFALRVGAVAFPLLTLILWRGVPATTLTRIAVLLLAVAVPLAYLITSPRNQGGYNFSYSVDLLWAHWIGVAAIVLLGLAAFKEIVWARRHRGPSSPGSGPGAGGRVDEPEQDPARGVEQPVVAR